MAATTEQMSPRQAAEILGMNPEDLGSITSADVKKAYRPLAQKYHPDKGGYQDVGGKVAPSIFIEMNEVNVARDTLIRVARSNAEKAEPAAASAEAEAVNPSATTTQESTTADAGTEPPAQEAPRAKETSGAENTGPENVSPETGHTRYYAYENAKPDTGRRWNPYAPSWMNSRSDVLGRTFNRSAAEGSRQSFTITPAKDGQTVMMTGRIGNNILVMQMDNEANVSGFMVNATNGQLAYLHGNLAEGRITATPATRVQYSSYSPSLDM